jgi:RNA polymerase sigma factor (sigma-70 family)
LAIDPKTAFVADVATKHGGRLRRYLAARLRNATDVADLAQEVFLRLLRVDRHDKIRNPESYLFTIASHVLLQHNLNRSADLEPVDITDPLIDLRHAVDSDPEERIHLERRHQEIEKVLDRLSPAAHASMILHCRDGWTLDEIAVRLGVSRSMVKKHLAQALLRCRQKLGAPE